MSLRGCGGIEVLASVLCDSLSLAEAPVTYWLCRRQVPSLSVCREADELHLGCVYICGMCVSRWVYRKAGRAAPPSHLTQTLKNALIVYSRAWLFVVREQDAHA